MKTTLFALLTLGLPLLAQQSGATLTQGDRDYALSALHGTRKQLLDSVSGLTPAQWSFKPSSEAWSIAQVVEHLALSEESLPAAARKALAEPATPEKKQANRRQIDEQIVKTTPVREQKFKAPETLQPAGRFASPAKAAEVFRTRRDANLTYIRTTPDDLRGHFLTHPALGEVDCLQWYLVLAGHTERHVRQIEEVKAQPGYPKR